MTTISNTAQLSRRLRAVALTALLGTGLLVGSFHFASAAEAIPASQAQGSDQSPSAGAPGTDAAAPAASIGLGWG